MTKPRRIAQYLSCFAAFLCMCVALNGCGTDAPESGADDRARQSETGSERLPFEDRTEALGVDFVHENGMTGELIMVEMVGAGVALLDYDRDGDLDLYFVQGGPLPNPGPGQSEVRIEGMPGDRLYRNEMTAGKASTLRFVDATRELGLDRIATGYGQGVAVGDFDRDGWPDLYLANFGPDQLLRNLGPDGGFEDVSARALSADSEPLSDSWSTSVSMVDLDSDGRLDIVVGRYLDATLANHFNCTSEGGLVDYCGPLSYKALPNVVLHNRSQGSRVAFADVSSASGVGLLSAPTLGVATFDADQDGDLDIFVANDQRANHLWLNRSRGSLLLFEEDAALAGCAVNREGVAEASMGVDIGDVDGDGLEDLLLAHLRAESNTLYRNLGGGTFTDATSGTGLGPTSLPYTSFGLVLFDFDLDGDLDAAIANGTVKRLPDQIEAGFEPALRQPDQLFEQRPDGRFEEISDQVPALLEPSVSRGLTVGDLDNDGDLDIVLTRNNDRAQVLISNATPDTRGGEVVRAGWIGVELERPGHARVELEGMASQVRFARADGSYLSARDPRVLLAVPDRPAEVSIRVTRPNGESQLFEALATGRYHRLEPDWSSP